jgi:hypothetical protein
MYSYIKRSKTAATIFSLALFASCCFALIATTSADGSTNKKVEGWEPFVLKGNQYLLERSRSSDARKYYQQALKLLEKEHIDDLRKAIVLNDIAETYRLETKPYPARLQELRAGAIYKREIDDHQLGYEYSSKTPIDTESGGLRPHCYICHENWKVVPILYGKGNGYPNEAVPNEEDASYTHKPGGPVWGDQRWYCKECHQSF